MEPHTDDHVASPPGRKQVPPPRLRSPASRGRIPIEFKPNPGLLCQHSRGRDMEEQNTPRSPPRAGSGDDYQSQCSSAPTEDTGNSVPSTPVTSATSAFDEPHLYDSLGEYTHTLTSLSRRARVSSIDSESFPESSTSIRGFKNIPARYTFPIPVRPTTAHRPSSRPPIPGSTLRTQSYPLPDQSSLEPAVELERDSGLGDDADVMDQVRCSCEEVPEESEGSDLVDPGSSDDTISLRPSCESLPDTCPDEVGPSHSPHGSSMAIGCGPSSNMIDDTYDYILEHIFDTETTALDDRSRIWVSVRHCLEEISHIVDSGSGPVSDSPDLPCSGPGSVSGHGSSASRGSGGGRKRGHSQSDAGPGSGSGAGGDAPQDTGRNGGGDDGSGPGGAGRIAKKPKMELDLNMSCPYRKRNPLRFNIRDHPSCASKPYGNMADLKRHIKNQHSRKKQISFVCGRCKEPMKTAEALEEHQTLDDACKPRKCQPQPQSAPEDGITALVESILNDRTNTGKVDNWDMLWHTLFGADEKPPSHEFDPPIELDEVERAFRESLKLLPPQLRQGFQGLDQDLREQTCRIGETVFVDFMNSTFQLCRAKYGNSAPSMGRLRSSGSEPTSRGPATTMPRPRSQEFLMPPTPSKTNGSGSTSSYEEVPNLRDPEYPIQSGIVLGTTGSEYVNLGYASNPPQARAPPGPSFMSPLSPNPPPPPMYLPPGDGNTRGYIPELLSSHYTPEMPTRAAGFPGYFGSLPAGTADGLGGANPMFGATGDDFDPVVDLGITLGGIGAGMTAGMGYDARRRTSSRGSRGSSWERVPKSSKPGAPDGQSG